MGFMDALDLSASGMTAERLRMDVISNNLANANATRTASGQPYRRQQVVLTEQGASFGQTLSALENGGANFGVTSAKVDESGLQGVRVAAIVNDPAPFREVFEPGNPDADTRGYVSMPNVSVVTEMVDMMSASRAYEADVTAVNSAKSMAEKALEIGQA